MAAITVVFLLSTIYSEFVCHPFSIGLLQDESFSTPEVEMKTQLIKYGIMPEVIDDVPKHLLGVKYGSHYTIWFGMKVNPDYLSFPPHISWPFEESKFYSILMIDPDHPSRTNPTEREFLLWLVVNIPKDKRLEGQDVASYRPPDPEPDSGPHRFIYMVFEQPEGKIDSNEPYSDVYNDKYRNKFSTRQFAKKYGLGTPLAINFFIGEKCSNGTSTVKASTSVEAT